MGWKNRNIRLNTISALTGKSKLLGGNLILITVRFQLGRYFYQMQKQLALKLNNTKIILIFLM